jgi:hypothetical protein
MSVAVEPQRIARIEFQLLGEQRRRDVGGAKRRARMALARVLDGVHRQEPDRIGEQSGVDTGHRISSPAAVQNGPASVNKSGEVRHPSLAVGTSDCSPGPRPVLPLIFLLDAICYCVQVGSSEKFA